MALLQRPQRGLYFPRLGSGTPAVKHRRWNRQACIGFRCSKSWKCERSNRCWSMLHLKNVPGRKKIETQDCQWTLRGSFRPPDEICRIRSQWRHRENLIQLASVNVQHMQKALDQMDIQLHHVISDLTGTTGSAIVDAILSGERDPSKLAEPRDCRIHVSRQTVMKSLVGDYRKQQLFVLAAIVTVVSPVPALDPRGRFRSEAR
jgi:hypothetical protein